MLLIKGGRVIDPEGLTESEADVVVGEEKIIGIGKYEPTEAYQQVIDATGKAVAPGLVDVHVHFRDPGFTYKEDIQTGAAAAAAGGYTTVVCMANTKPPVDSAEILRYVLDQGKKTGIHVLSDAAITVGMKGQELVNMEELKAAGAVGFTDDGAPLMNAGLVKLAMEKAARLHVPLSFHEEDPTFIQNNGIHHGAISQKLGIYGSPSLAEDSLAARDCMIALYTDASINIQHISSKSTVEIIDMAKRIGAHVTGEVTPHHFSLTEDAVLRFGTLAKMNPPLRTELDRKALIKGLQNGAIDIIATDHAPHSSEEKERPLTQAPSGIIGLETALALGITELVEPGYLALPMLIKKMSLNPARLYHLECGRMKPGAPADLVIFDPKEHWVVNTFRSKSSNSPFVGWELTGKVCMTICDGKIVYDLHFS